jgi:hypothetical protein
MRTTARLSLVLAVVATAGLLAVPTVSAKSKSDRAGAWISQLSDLEKNQNTGIRQARRRAAAAHRRIENLKDFAFGLAANNNKQQTDIDAVSGTVATIVAGVPAIIDGLTQLQGGLVALQGALQNTVSPALTALSNGLTSINAALQNPTTGLVGLNNARPQFGAFNGADGAIIAGTGQVTGAKGPSTSASNPADGRYIVDFGNNVVQRFLTVTPFPTGGAAVVGSAVNCDANATAEASCEALGDPAGGNPNHVLVVIQRTNDSAPVDATFAVSAISG